MRIRIIKNKRKVRAEKGRSLVWASLLSACLLASSGALALDGDGDGVADGVDAFVADGCASLDTDADGKPDAIHPRGNCLIDGFESGGFSANPWSTSTNPWTVVSGGQSGSKAARQALLKSSYLRLTKTFAADGRLYFYFKNAGTAAGGTFTVNGSSVIGSFAKTTTWTLQVVPLSAGSLTLQWNSPSPVFSLSPELWLDNIAFSPLVEDLDDDNDGVADGVDAFPLDSSETGDNDGDGSGNNADADDDNDSVADSSDNCPLLANTDQLDTEADGVGDACDGDRDNDTVLNGQDNCPLQSNTNQLDSNGNGLGDLCDPDPGAPAPAGSRDFSFNVTASAQYGDLGVYALAAQADGKVIVGGAFNTINGVTRNRIARLLADGSLDNSFNASFDGPVHVLKVQADGKVLVGGAFNEANGLYYGRLVRLHPDGSLDTSFSANVVTVAYSTVSVSDVLVQPDGRVILAGDFTVADEGVTRRQVIRLEADGSIDKFFELDSRLDATTVYAMALQLDGSILLVGEIVSSVDNIIRKVMRLHGDGTLDESFSSPEIYGAYPDVYKVALQSDGRIVIGGAFTEVSGVARPRIARLEANGTLDPTFNMGTGPGGGDWSPVQALLVQPDDKIIVAGSFTNVDGIARNRIARLGADGSLDASFDPGTGANDYVAELALQIDGRVVIAGALTRYNGSVVSKLLRIHSGDADADGVQDAADAFPENGAAAADLDRDGLADSWLQPGSVACAINDLACNGLSLDDFIDLDRDGALATDNCALYNPDQVDLDGDGLGNICDVDVDGDGLDNMQDNCPGHSNADQQDSDSDGLGNMCDDDPFRAFAGALDTSFFAVEVDGYVGKLLRSSDGKVLLAGAFNFVNGVARNNIARLNADNTLDTSFSPGSGADSEVMAMLLQPDGRVLIGGNFTSFNGVARQSLARLNADGSLDMSFDAGIDLNYADSVVVSALALQSDGSILIGGMFSSINGMRCDGIARLRANGSLDTAFVVEIDYGPVNAFIVQPDNKVLIAGYFTAVNGVARNSIARLNTDGTLDSTFDPGFGIDGTVMTILRQPDGKVVVGGYFLYVDGEPANHITRLNSDGSRDISFDPGTGVDGRVRALALAPDGKLLVGGSFLRVNGISSPYLARLKRNGALDDSFDTSPGFDNYVRALALQGSKLLVAGAFSEYKGAPAAHIARIHLGKSRNDFDADGDSDLFWRDGSTGQNVVWILQGGLKTGAHVLGSNATAYTVEGIADFDGDGDADVLFRNNSTGQSIIWVLENGVKASAVLLGSNAVSYAVAGVADFDGDGDADILFRDAAGNNVIWRIQNAARENVVVLGSNAAAYMVGAIQDFDGDGDADILFRNSSTGYNLAWRIENAAKAGAAVLGSNSAAFAVMGAADFDGDGDGDILFRDNAGNNVIWKMQDGNKSGASVLGANASSYSVAGTADFDADGDADILFRDTAGNNVIWKMQDGSKSGANVLGANASSYSVAGTADFDGDGDEDILFRNNSTGANVLWTVQNNAKAAATVLGSNSGAMEAKFGK